MELSVACLLERPRFHLDFISFLKNILFKTGIFTIILYYHILNEEKMSLKPGFFSTFQRILF
jgi:hypothetical protein